MIAASWIIAGAAWRALWRGKSLWIPLCLCLAPVLVAALPGVVDSAALRWQQAAGLGFRAVTLSAAILLANAIGEELEQRTVSYLWTHPIPRAALPLGKLAAMAPVVLGLGALALLACFAVAHRGFPFDHLDMLARAIAAVLLGGLAACATALGLGALVPRYAFILALAYLLFLDNLLELVPGLSALSIIAHMNTIAGIDTSGSVPTACAALVVLALLWLGAGLWRLKRL
ncbi:ABC transporter permease [Haliangium ochraceum]|uniref:ABC transporter permease n=1 Tax=Haliangium ochraceum (strain DSM 14365 / JCM 11303 / SMP-2) TaxID=502025 RepID=D0LHV0_HALO1|nr:ABC transporter permease [Haliangium ochraceum]ACY14779.1 hypothetical protein Hoch_2236 [Haliangium ochraceum DSM 14365]